MQMKHSIQDYVNVVKQGITKNFKSEKPKKVKEVIEFVKKSGGIEYAIDSMNKFHQDALAIIREFPDSRYRQSLIQLVQFTIDRNN